MTAAPVAEPVGGLADQTRTRLMLVVAALVLGTVLAGLAAWSIYRDLAAVIDGRAFRWALLFASAPVLPLAAAILFLDRMRPEPATLLAIATLWGALGATYIALQLNLWFATRIGDVQGATTRSAVFVAPWVEEVAKGAVIFAIVLWRRHRFNAVLAGLVYGGLVGVGFAFTENVVYYGQLFQQVYNQTDSGAALDAVKQLFFWRGLAAPFVHPMFTMMTGVGVGFALRHRHIGVRIVAPVAGFCAAVLLHMSYNTIASFATGQSLRAVYVVLLLPTLLGLATAVLVVRQHERAVIAARLRDYTAYGWLTPAVVPYLATGSGRRAALRYAKPFGREQRSRVREFQRCGVELGVLRDRVVRGVAGPSEQSAEAQLIAELRATQRHVLLPPDASSNAAAELAAYASSW